MSLYTDVRVLINETSEAFWLDESVYDAINVVQSNIYANNPRIIETSTTMPFLMHADFVEIPSSIMVPKYILGTDSEPIYQVSHAELEEYNANWMDTTPGYPTRFVMWDTQYIRPYPRADVTYNFTIFGVPWPTEIADGTLDITASRYLKRAISYGAAARLLEHTRPDLADAYQANMEESLALHRQMLRNSHSHNISRLRPVNYEQMKFSLRN